MRDVALDPSRRFIAPGENPAIHTPRRFFPFRFGGQPFARPSAVGVGLMPTHVDDGMKRCLFRKRAFPPKWRPVRSCGKNESQIIHIRHFVLIDLECIEIHFVLRQFLRTGCPILVRVTPHQKPTSGHRGHSVWHLDRGHPFRFIERCPERRLLGGFVIRV
jgi:hypothetical protein